MMLASASCPTTPCICSARALGRPVLRPGRLLRSKSGTSQVASALNDIFGQKAQPGVDVSYEQQPFGTPDAPELPPYAVIQKQGEAGAGFDIRVAIISHCGKGKVRLTGTRSQLPLLPVTGILAGTPLSSAGEMRMYQTYAVVEMDYQRRDEGYLALGEYVGGANSTNSRFGFTAPMVMRYHPDGRKVMQMMVGTQRNWQQLPDEQRAHRDGSSRVDPRLLPAPTNPAVRIGVSGGEVVAVLAFEGFITPETAAWARQRLIKLLEEDGRFKLAEEEADGLFRVGQYGAIHTLEARVNEMMLAVDFSS